MCAYLERTPQWRKALLSPPPPNLLFSPFAGAAIHYIPLQMGDKLEDQNAAMNMDARDEDEGAGDNGGNDNQV